MVVPNPTILHSHLNKTTLLFCQWRVPLEKMLRQAPLTLWYFFLLQLCLEWACHAWLSVYFQTGTNEPESSIIASGQLFPLGKYVLEKNLGQFFSVSDHGNWMSQNTKPRFVNAQVTVVQCPPPLAGLSIPLCSCQLSKPKLHFFTGLIFLSLMSPALPIEFLPTSIYELQWQGNVPEMHHIDIFEQCRHSVSLWPSYICRHYWACSVMCTYKLEHPCDRENSTWR